MALGWLWCHTPCLSHTHHLSHPTLSQTICHTHLCQPPSFTHHLCHTPSFTHHLSHTIFHTQLCHTPSLTHHLSHTISHTPSMTRHLSHHFVTHHPSHTHTHLCHTPSFTHNFVSHHLSPPHPSHTTLSHTTFHHTILHTPLCHTPFFTTPYFTHSSVTQHLSHTTLSHARFHTQLSHTPSFFVTHHLSHTTLSHTTLFYFSILHHLLCLSFLPSASPLQHLVLIIGRSCLVGLSGPLIYCKKKVPRPEFGRFFTRLTHYTPNPGTFHEFLQQGHCSSLQQLVGILLGAEYKYENDFMCK